MFFGHLGDRYGRKRAFLQTILLMGVSTTAIGVLPGIQSIGVAAPMLLVLTRVVQGFAMGGEYGGAAVYVAEHAHPKRRGFLTGWIQSTAAVGLLLAVGAVLGVRLWVGESAFQRLGLAAPVPVLRRATRDLAVDTPEAGGKSGIPTDAHARCGGPRTVAGSLAGREPAAHRAGARLHPAGAGRRVVHGTFLRPVLHRAGAEGRCTTGQCSDHARGGSVLAGVCVLRLVVRSRRSQARDAGGDGGELAALLPGISPADGGGKSRAAERGATPRRWWCEADPDTCRLQFDLLRRNPPHSACDVLRTALADGGVPYRLVRTTDRRLGGSL